MKYSWDTFPKRKDFDSCNLYVVAVDTWVKLHRNELGQIYINFEDCRFVESVLEFIRELLGEK